MKKKTKLSMLGLAISSMILVGCGEKAETPAQEPTPTPAPASDPTPETKPEPAEQRTEIVYEDVKVMKSEAADIEIPATTSDEITDIKLDKQVVSMYYSDKAGSTFDDELTLNATVYPKKAGDRNIKWTSNDKTVATVDENGKVTAVGQGYATITASNEDGTVKASTRVAVTNFNNQKLQYCKDRMQEIMDAQESEEFVKPESITSIERFDHSTTKNGTLISRTFYEQELTSSLKNAYLDLNIDRLEVRCENGSPVPSKTHYTFYTTDQYETLMFKSSGKVKNYASINQSNFMGQEKIEALKAICNQWFVSGSEILTGVEEELYARDNKNYLENTTMNPRYGIMDDVEGELAFTLEELDRNQQATAKTETNSGIPEGTIYDVKFNISYLYENNVLSAEHFEQIMTYTLGSDSYVNKFIIDYCYKTNQELVYPNKDNYQKVDNATGL